MTWREFVTRVEEQLAANGIPDTTEIAEIDWNRECFGVYENGDVIRADVFVQRDAAGRLCIGED